MSALYCYELSPIDWWAGSLPFEMYLMTLHDPDEVQAAYALLNEAKRLATLKGWEGDMREGPYVFALPPSDGYCNFDVGIAFKQDNNGQTYVTSPRPLPWLGVDGSLTGMHRLTAVAQRDF